MYITSSTDVGAQKILKDKKLPSTGSLFYGPLAGVEAKPLIHHEPMCFPRHPALRSKISRKIPRYRKSEKPPAGWL